MRYVYDERHRSHAPPEEVEAGTRIPHYESVERADMIHRALEAGPFERVPARRHGLEPILAVHDADLVAYLETAWERWVELHPGSDLFPDTLDHARLRAGMGAGPVPAHPDAAAGYWCFDTTTPITAGTFEAARASVDTALSACDLVVAGERVAYGLCRPPGHHAAQSVFGGYCYLNNAAIVAQYLVDQTGRRSCVLDVDFHHGNGTQQIFYDRDDVLFLSLHGDPTHEFPYHTGHVSERGTGEGAGATINLPLPPGVADDEYMAHLSTALEAVEEHGSELLVVSLGLDTFRADPLGNFALTTEGMARMGAAVSDLGRPMVVLQEGGYALDALGANARAWLEGASA